MSYIEPKEGSPNKFRLVVPDPAAAGTGSRKRLVRTIEVDDDLLKPSPRAQLKLEQYLNKELAKFEEEVESGEYIKPDRMTLTQFIPLWKKNYADKNMGGYTRKQALYYISKQVIPFFGHMRLDQIKTIHAVTFMSSRKRLPKPKKNNNQPDKLQDGADKPLATNTLLNIYKALKSVLDAAHQWKLIVHNPMDGVDRPTAGKREKREMRQKKKSYTRSETELVITALPKLSDTWRLFFIGAMLGGFRRGENLAHEWPQVNYKLGGIHVEKQITFDEVGNVVEDDVKTEQSADFVPLPWWYMAELEQLELKQKKARLQMGDKWRGGDKKYVFTNKYGECYYPTTPTLTWSRFLAKNGLPRVRLHDLRHTSAMLLKASKVDPERIKRHLRHTKLSTTTDLYMDDANIIDREAADQLEYLNPSRHPAATRDAE